MVHGRRNDISNFVFKYNVLKYAALIFAIVVIIPSQSIPTYTNYPHTNYTESNKSISSNYSTSLHNTTETNRNRQGGIDLSLTSLCSYTLVGVGRVCEINYTILSIGGTPSTNLTIFVNGLQNENVTIPAHSDGESLSYVWRYSQANAGLINVEAYLDITNAISENNETNNYNKAEFEFLDFSQIPGSENVGYSHIQKRAYNITDNQEHYFGIEGSDQVLSIIRENGSVVGSTSNTSIQPGLGFVKVIGEGVYFAIVSSENGTGSCVLYADLYVDLEPTELTVQYSTLYPIENEPISINASVTNRGTKSTSELVYLELFKEGNPVHVKYHIFSGISYGETKKVQWSMPLQRGDNRLNLIADLPGLINETDEKNNEKNLSIYVIPKLKIGSYESGYVNTGCAVYYAVYLDNNPHTFNLTGETNTDFDLYLLDSTGLEIASSIQGYPESITYTSSSIGWHYLKVVSYFGSGKFNLTADFDLENIEGGDFELNLSSKNITLLKGEECKVEVRIDRINNFSENVSLSIIASENYPELSFMPEFNDTELSLNEYAIITINTTQMFEGKKYVFRVRGAIQNGSVREDTIEISILPRSSFKIICNESIILHQGENVTLTVTATELNLYPANESIYLDLIMPDYTIGNITAYLEHETLIPYQGIITSNLTLQVLENATLGDYTFVINATFLSVYGIVSQVVSVNVSVISQDSQDLFVLVIEPKERAISQVGGVLYFNVYSIFSEGFSGPVYLAFSVPTGMNCIANDSVLNSSYEYSNLTVVVDSGLGEGNYTIYVIGTYTSEEGTIIINETAKIVVTRTSGGSFTLDVGPRLRTITAGSSASFSIVVTSYYGFSALVSLSCSITPQEETIHTVFNPQKIIPSSMGTASTLVVETTGTTPERQYVITINAVGGRISLNNSVTLEVISLNNSEVGIRLRAPAGQSASAGQTVNYIFRITNNGTSIDSFVISGSSSNRWSVTIGNTNSATTRINNVPSNDTREIRVSLLIPAGATAGSIDTLTITATSTLDPSYSVSARVQTTVSENICCSTIYFLISSIGITAIIFACIECIRRRNGLKK